ncbi:type II secretion system GspH family protein [bacterium]|nr:type II secretion system GspH family protein [bacterium]
MLSSTPVQSKQRPAFVLLEVMLALVILSVAMTALLRGFILSIHTIRENNIVATATLLAETLMEDYELEPPVEGQDEGFFTDDERFGEDFKNYAWEREVEESDVDYSDAPRVELQDPEPIYEMKLQIIYDDGENRRFVPIAIDTYLLETQLFSDKALEKNQLF